MRRRKFNQMLPMLAVMLAGCQNGLTVGGVTIIPPPSLAQVQSWAQSFSSELSGFITDLSGVLSSTTLATVQVYVGKFQALVTQFLQLPASTDPASILTGIDTGLNAVLSLIPATAPFVPLAKIFESIINGFITKTPVTDPATGTPVATPAVPTSAMLGNLHAQTRALRR